MAINLKGCVCGSVKDDGQIGVDEDGLEDDHARVSFLNKLPTRLSPSGERREQGKKEKSRAHFGGGIKKSTGTNVVFISASRRSILGTDSTRGRFSALKGSAVLLLSCGVRK